MEKSEILEILHEQGVSTWNEFRKRTPTLPSLVGANLDRQKLDDADFSSCDLRNAEIADCSLRYANFDRSQLNGINFHKCNLVGATFAGAILNDAKFYKCFLAGADFSQAEGITADQFDDCTGLEVASLPDEAFDDDVDDDVDSEDPTTDDEYVSDNQRDFSTDRDASEEFEQDDTYIDIGGNKRKMPRIPRRVPAPIETAWVDEKLTVTFEVSNSSLTNNIIEANIESFRIEANKLTIELRDTNVDRRVIERLERAASDIPISATSLSRRIFRIWHQFRPIFEYGRIVEAEESDFIRARFISLENDLRGLLNSYPVWRSYEYEASRLQMPEGFDLERLQITKQEIISSLAKFPNNIDISVTNSLNEIGVGPYFGGASYGRPYVYDFAATFANVLSRLLRKVTAEVATGGSEGVREGTKKLVTTVMVGGGATMVWLIANGLGLFPWLSRGWHFVKLIIGL